MLVTIKAAVIGPRELVTRVTDAASPLPELELTALPYTSESDAASLAKRVDEQVDVILFTGPVPYMIATQSKDRFTAELVHINYVGTGLYRVFFQILRDGLLQDGAKVSVDLLQKAEVLEASQELNLCDLQFSVLEFGPNVTSADMYQFHLNQWLTGQTDIVITCLYSIYERLRGSGVPAYCVLPTTSSIQTALRSVIELGRIKQFRNSQVAACIVHAVSEEPKEANYVNSAIGQALGTTGLKVDDKSYVFYTTRAVLSALTNGYTTPLTFGDVTQNDFVMGVGIGRNPNAAKVKAEEAYQQSKSGFSGSVYILDDDNSIVRLNPANHLVSLEYSNRTYDNQVRLMAEETNLSISTLSKILFVLKTTGEYTMTAMELAKHLDMTLRSARRILKAMADAGYASISGEEQPVTRGRPRNVYRINMLDPVFS